MKQLLDYKWEGDYLVPDLKIEEIPEPLTKYGLMRKDYILKHRPVLAAALKSQMKLFTHCLEIQNTAKERYDRMYKEAMRKNPPPHQNVDFLAHIQHKNQIIDQIEALIYEELIYS